MLVSFALALAWLRPEPASACSVLIPIFEAPEPTTTSTGVPSLRIEGYDLERGCGSGPGSGNCADIGHLSIALTASPEVAWETIGAYIRVQSGDAPIPYSYDRPFVIRDGVLSIAFGDGGGQPAIDFTITVQAIDGNGRLGPESEELHIEHGGGNAFCCACTSTSPARSEGATAWLLLAAFLLRRKAR
jgi:MYXO-CTERM domain-containing protein